MRRGAHRSGNRRLSPLISPRPESPKIRGAARTRCRGLQATQGAALRRCRRPVCSRYRRCRRVPPRSGARWPGRGHCRRWCGCVSRADLVTASVGHADVQITVTRPDGGPGHPAQWSHHAQGQDAAQQHSHEQDQPGSAGDAHPAGAGEVPEHGGGWFAVGDEQQSARCHEGLQHRPSARGDAHCHCLMPGPVTDDGVEIAVHRQHSGQAGETQTGVGPDPKRCPGCPLR